MRKFILLFIFILMSGAAFADDKKQLLDKLTGKVSEFTAGLIPGDGVSEVSITVPEDNEPQIEILAVRDIVPTDYSNFFTQFSLHNQEINNRTRYVTNLGLGYRTLNSDKTMMYGTNIFWDHDLDGHHSRASIGLEAKASMLDFTFNQYIKTVNMKPVRGTEEQVLNGREFNLTSQMPYMPWSKINWQNYKWENEKAANDSKGNILSLAMLLTPTLTFEIAGDYSDNSGVDDEYTYSLNFNYPPKNNTKTLQDGAVASLAFEKENVEKKLKEKIRRTNDMVVEVQGAVIITSK